MNTKFHKILIVSLISKKVIGSPFGFVMLLFLNAVMMTAGVNT
ncbi:MAG: hypothetical protein ACFE8M_09705 [Candidatus Hermodarchaeota archaeon]